MRQRRELFVALVLEEHLASSRLVDAVAEVEAVPVLEVPKPVDADVEVAAARPVRGLELDDAEPPGLVIEPRARTPLLQESERPQCLACGGVDQFRMRVLTAHGHVRVAMQNPSWRTLSQREAKRL